METRTTPSGWRAKKPKTHQHRARVLALQVLYEIDITGHEWQASLTTHAAATESSERVIELATTAIEGVRAAMEQVDELITTYAPMWPLDQLSPVDRNVLRLALYELLPGSMVPPKVAINEAVELAKEFGGAASSRFVNGVLGAALEGLNSTSTTSTD
jgi:transcription antitermination protein NusB